MVFTPGDVWIYSSQTDQSGSSIKQLVRLFEQKKQTLRDRVRLDFIQCVCVCGAHPWQLAHSSSRTETSNRAVRVLSTTAKTSCPPPDHRAAPVSADPSEWTTFASGPHHTPLSTGAMMHHRGEDIRATSWGEKRKQAPVDLKHVFSALKPA